MRPRWWQSSDLCLWRSKRTRGDGAFAWGGGWESCALTCRCCNRGFNTDMRASSSHARVCSAVNRTFKRKRCWVRDCPSNPGNVAARQLAFAETDRACDERTEPLIRGFGNQWYTETAVSHIDFSLQGKQKMYNLQPSDPLKPFKTAPLLQWKYCFCWCNNKTSVVRWYIVWLCMIMHLTGRNKAGKKCNRRDKPQKVNKRGVRDSLKTKGRMLLRYIKPNSQVRQNTIPIGPCKYADQC